ncbi:MAG: ATP-binding protein [Selenomonadaceae bacterium]|nr:ATP-binding protein [Selenomonadaceae bacterium]
MRKLPIGIQSFEKLISSNFVYVDKTEYVYRLASEESTYFLSRPRRFGKSLFLSTLKAYFEGKRELFAGLKIMELTRDNPEAWQAYPVFYFDFTGEDYSKEEALESLLDEHLRRWEELHALDHDSMSLGERFRALLLAANRQSGLRSVVLVDEYDKPLLEVMNNPQLLERNKATFKGFFSTLKGFDQYIQFTFITGVTKFTRVSPFSDLNNLNDISLEKKYADICGITKKELLSYFQPEIVELAAEQSLTIDQCIKELQECYDGYHFHPSTGGVYNPFSLLKAFYAKELGSYWFATGTPTFLINKMKFSQFDVRQLTNGTLGATEAVLENYRGEDSDPIPLLYQAGYLTLAGYDRRRNLYRLIIPNREVEYGLLECLLPSYVPNPYNNKDLDIYILSDYIDAGDLDGIKNVITALFAGIPYTNNDAPFEHYFQTVIYLVFKLLGRYIQCEMYTATGRIDCTLATNDYIYLFEFKRDSTAKAALEQIEAKQYALPFAADKRKLYKIGVAFDSETRLVSDWSVGEQNKPTP